MNKYKLLTIMMSYVFMLTISKDIYFNDANNIEILIKSIGVVLTLMMSENISKENLKPSIVNYIITLLVAFSFVGIGTSFSEWKLYLQAIWYSKTTFIFILIAWLLIYFSSRFIYNKLIKNLKINKESIKGFLKLSVIPILTLALMIKLFLMADNMVVSLILSSSTSFIGCLILYCLTRFNKEENYNE